MLNRATVLFPCLLASSAAIALSGDLDTSFSSDGLVLTNFGSEDVLKAVAQQPADNKIVVVGTSAGDWLVARYTTSGALDTSFDGDGRATVNFGSSTDTAEAVAIQADGRIVVAGRGNNGFGAARFNGNGTLDTTFGTGGITSGTFVDGAIGAKANAVAINADNRIVIAGQTHSAGSANGDFGVARLTTAGQLDPTFGSGGRLAVNISGEDRANALAVAATGEIFVVGVVAANSTNSNFAISLFSSNGVAQFFSTRAVIDFNGCGDAATSVAIQADGKIVVAGRAGPTAGGATTCATSANAGIVRYNADRSLDTSFDGDGLKTTGFGGISTTSGANALAIQLDGSIVVAGSVVTSTTARRLDFGLARLKGTNGALDLSFSGDSVVQTSFGAGEAVAQAILLQRLDGRIVAVGQFSTFDANGALLNRDVALARYHAITCNNLNATRVGTNGADSIFGTEFFRPTGTLSVADVIHGMGDNDTIDGRGNNDTICGGSGDDQLSGGTGNDTLFGEVGLDNMNGGDGTDTCFAGTKGSPPVPDNDSFQSCETTNTGLSGLSGEWLRLEQHCSTPAGETGRQCVLTGILSAFNPGQESTAVPAQVSYFLSADDVLDETDTHVGTAEVRAVPAGGAQQLPFVHRLPGETDLLGHYVIAFVDSTDVIPERNEENNLAPGVISGR